MDSVSHVQILDEIVCISIYANNHVKIANPSRLSPSMSNLVEQTEIFSFYMVTSPGESQIWIQTSCELL